MILIGLRLVRLSCSGDDGWLFAFAGLVLEPQSIVMHG